ncbi:hypothetical protein PLICRDRAFT_120922 [Plicaturopsis crispa FD-325 SS-3]|nr:hypothetical protein PLICRDRAFT_120922 [Plicaturopsis crispa FD-325 SS-3]
MAHDPSETVDPPRKRAGSFFLVLLFIIAPFWLVVPLAWTFVIYALRTGKIWSFYWPGRLLFGAALCEVFFSVYHWNLAELVSRNSPHSPGSLTELQNAYSRVLKAGLAQLPEDGFDEETLDVDRPGSPAEEIEQLRADDPRAIDFRTVLRTWFGGAPWSHLRRTEVRAWLYWSIFNAPLPLNDDLQHAHRVVLNDALDLLQKRSGTIIPDGSNPSVKPMLMTLDKVKVSWRPFGFYVFVAVLNMVLKIYYTRFCGFRLGCYNGLEYIIRVPKSWNQSSGARPLVFVHGLGLGLAQYHHLLSNLRREFTDRPILVPLQPHISQDIFHPQYLKPLNRYEAANALAGLLAELGWADPKKVDELGLTEDEQSEGEESTKGASRKGVTMMSHSNGSYFHAWMLKSHGKMVSRSCFVDPVTFCSWEGHVCYNFLYRPCKTGIELIMRYFVGTELGVANLLYRHFEWSSNALWYEDIPNARDPSKTMFALGGQDSIVNAERVKRYLTSHGIRKGLWYDPNGRHGQALIRGGKGHAEILRWLQADC